MVRVSERDLVDEWRSLLARHATISGELERELESAHGIGVSEFETLDRLVEAGPDQRMNDLADRIHLSQSALSRAVARLERDGRVSRTLCSVDRRGVFVCVTEAGRTLHAEARKTRRRVLRQMLTSVG